MNSTILVVPFKQYYHVIVTEQHKPVKFIDIHGNLQSEPHQFLSVEDVGIAIELYGILNNV